MDKEKWQKLTLHMSTKSSNSWQRDKRKRMLKKDVPCLGYRYSNCMLSNAYAAILWSYFGHISNTFTI